MSAPNIHKRIMIFRDFVPNKLSIFLCILFAVIFQFSGGIYLSSVSQMVGSTSLMQEDIMMAGYASFVGMTIVFPVLFRLKFRFTTRSILLFICPALIVCNIITMNTTNLPILVTFCFIAGVLRMWGTFEALSNVQLSITPTRNFAIFFSFVYLIVMGTMQISGLVTVNLGYWANWKFMHMFIIGLLLVLWGIVFYVTQHFRFMKPMPLFGIDWIGGVLWAIFILSLVFVFEYGKFYDWLHSYKIAAGCFIAVLSLATSIHRMIVRKRPYISFEAFKYRNLTFLLILFLALCFFLTAPTVLQSIFTSSILKYDILNNSHLNWYALIGVVSGAIMAYTWHVKLHGEYKLSVFFGFFLIFVYQCMMYFYISPDMNIERLYLPTIIRNAGYIILYISLTTYVSSIVPFQHFFQVLSILGFIRTGLGSVLGGAIYGRMLQYILPKNIQNISRELDAVNFNITNGNFASTYADTVKQAMLVSLKEMYGWICILSVIFLVLILAERFLNKRIVGSLPRIRRIKYVMKHN